MRFYKFSDNISIWQRRHRLLLSSSSQPVTKPAIHIAILQKCSIFQVSSIEEESQQCWSLYPNCTRKRKCSVYYHKKKQAVFNLTTNRKHAAKSPCSTYSSFSSKNSISLAQPLYRRKHATILPLLLSSYKPSSNCLVSLPDRYHPCSWFCPPFCSFSWNLFVFRH